MFFIIKILSLLPLSILYKVADAIYVLVYYISGYRKKVVRSNLTKAFPGMSEVKRHEVEKKFYSNFCDFLVESVKAFSISAEEIQRRVTFTNIDEFENLTTEKGSVIMLASHQFNWEWMQLSASLQFPVHLDYIYHPLHNKQFDNLMLKLRGRFGAGPIKRREAARQIIRRNKKNIGFALVADQLPSGRDRKSWVKFLNNETAFFASIEQLARLINQPVAYFNIRKLKRGNYEVEMTLLSSEPRKEAEGVITEKYAQAIEENIKRQPENWLWSHKRWKLKPPQKAISGK